MPHAVPIIVTYVVTSIVGITTWSLNTAIAIAFLAQFTGQIQENNRRRPEVDLGNRLVQGFAETAARRIIYGKVKVAPHPIAFTEAGAFSVIVYAVCEHDIERIDGLYFNNGKFLNDSEIETLNTAGEVEINSWSSSDGDDLGDLRKLYGEDSERVLKTAVTIILAKPSNLDRKLAEITGMEKDMSGMRSPTTTCMIVAYPSPSRTPRVRANEQRAIFASPPQMQVDVDRGRHDMWHEFQPVTNDYNAAAAFRDYVEKYTDYGQTVFGRGRLDTASFDAAVVSCETEGYEAHGMITLNDSNEVVFEQFMLAMGGGWISDNGGIISIRPNTSLTATSTLTADHVLSDWSVIPQTPRSDRFSDITISHINDEGEIDTTTYHSQEARDQFGDREQVLEASLVRGSDQAYRLAETLANRAFHSTQIELVMNASGLTLIPGDVVNLDLPQIGLDHERAFTVVTKRINPDLTTTINLAEYSVPPAEIQTDSAEAEISYANGTASMTSLALDVPNNVIGGGRGSPTIDTTYWEATFDAETVESFNPDIAGYEVGVESGASYGSLVSGSVSIPANTIPGITSARTVALVFSRRTTGNVYSWALGFEPDQESEDLMVIPEGTRFIVEHDGAELFNGLFSDAFIGQDDHQAERFVWDVETLTHLEDGDRFTAKIVHPTGANPNYIAGMVLTRVDLVAPIPQGQTAPIYRQFGDVRLTLTGTRTEPRNPDARIAVINTSRVYEGDGIMTDNWLWGRFSTETVSGGNTVIYTPTRFLARALDTSWAYGIETDDRFKVILYEATGPIPTELLT